jgi:hypothetical protein
MRRKTLLANIGPDIRKRKINTSWKNTRSREVFFIAAIEYYKEGIIRCPP